MDKSGKKILKNKHYVKPLSINSPNSSPSSHHNSLNSSPSSHSSSPNSSPSSHHNSSPKFPSKFNNIDKDLDNFTIYPKFNKNFGYSASDKSMVSASINFRNIAELNNIEFNNTETLIITNGHEEEGKLFSKIVNKTFMYHLKNLSLNYNKIDCTKIDIHNIFKLVEFNIKKKLLFENYIFKSDGLYATTAYLSPPYSPSSSIPPSSYSTISPISKKIIGGTSAIIVFINKKSSFLIIYHVGAMLSTIFNKQSIFEIGTNHTPLSLSENIRINETAKIKPRIIFDIKNSLTIERPRYVFNDEYELNPNGGYSFDDLDNQHWSTKLTNIECIYSSKVTRSFGDYHLSDYGIITVPDKQEYSYSVGDILVIASPDFWKLFYKFEFKLLLETYSLCQIIDLVKEKDPSVTFVIIKF